MKKVLILLLFVFSFSAISFASPTDLDNSDKIKNVTDVGIFTADVVNVAIVSVQSEQNFLVGKLVITKVSKECIKEINVFTTAQIETPINIKEEPTDVGWQFKADNYNSTYLKKEYLRTDYERICLQINKLSIKDAEIKEIIQRYKNNLYSRFNLWII